MISSSSQMIKHFNPRSSCEERLEHISDAPLCKISIHAPHARSDLPAGARAVPADYFNPRSSCEERPAVGVQASVYLFISIHAPHARSDLILIAPHIRRLAISIHAPHARSDALCPCQYALRVDFNPRSSCEERHARLDGREVGHDISIHAPHARSDVVSDRDSARKCLFQSTLLMRGATNEIIQALQTGAFQSTLLMRGATRHHCMCYRPSSDFNPRSSCEERHNSHLPVMRTDYFNPRSSCEERRVAAKWSNRLR